MSKDNPDIIETLEEQLLYHREQIKRIRTAIQALKADTPVQQRSTSESVPWTSEIRKLFDEHDQLSVEEVREKLAEKGLPAMDEKHYPTIQSILSRLRGTLVDRVEPGTYRIRPAAFKRHLIAEEVKRRIRNQDEDE